MNYRAHATKTLAIKRLTETLVSPAFYITISASLLIGCFFVSDFVTMIGSDGINTGKSQVYGLVFNMIRGIFGELFTDRLFAQGPYLFAISLSFFIFITYLAMSTVMQFGNEKSSGALEVIASGPADETCCFLGYFAVNVALSALFLCAATIIFIVSALITNMTLTATYFSYLVFLLIGSVVTFAYCTLASVLTRTAITSLAFLTAGLAIFGAVQFGMYGTVSESGNIIAGSVSFVIQWISPFFPMNFGSEAAEYGSIVQFLASILVPIAVCAGILGGSHFISRKRGVRI
jgi:hypothetical protein